MIKLKNHADKRALVNFWALVSVKVDENIIETNNFAAIAASNKWERTVALTKFEANIHNQLKPPRLSIGVCTLEPSVLNHRDKARSR
jgi:hypothetical protein